MLWALVVLDVMAVAWMLSAGDWLDHASPVTAVVTLGGHHVVVLWLAVAGFALLGGMALLTGGFAMARRGQVPFVVLSALVSVVALAGVLSALLFVVIAVLLLTLLGAAFLGGARCSSAISAVLSADDRCETDVSGDRSPGMSGSQGSWASG